MKKLFSHFALLAILFAFSLSGCQKEVNEVAPSVQNSVSTPAGLPLEGVQVKSYGGAGGRNEGQISLVAFESVAAFEKTVKSLTPEVQKAWEQALQFQSLRNAVETKKIQSLIQDDHLATVLNTNGMVQIGKWICRVDMERKLVSVITQDNAAAIHELSNPRTTNSKVMWFTTDDDVLPMLEAGSTGTLNKKGGRAEWFWCSEDGVQGKKDDEPNPTWNEMFYYLADTKVVYQKAGIYFSLVAELKYMRRYVSFTGSLYDPIPTEIRLTYFFRYKPKCGNERSSWNPEYMTLYNSNKLTRRPYESTTGLNKYEYRADFTYQDISGQYPVFIPIRTLYIEEGY